jgi:hypothetical protein
MTAPHDITRLIAQRTSVTIRGKEYVLRQPTGDEWGRFRHHFGIAPSPDMAGEIEALQTADGVARLLCIMYGVPYPDAMAFVEGEYARITAAVAAELDRLDSLGRNPHGLQFADDPHVAG